VRGTGRGRGKGTVGLAGRREPSKAPRSNASKSSVVSMGLHGAPSMLLVGRGAGGATGAGAGAAAARALTEDAIDCSSAGGVMPTSVLRAPSAPRSRSGEGKGANVSFAGGSERGVSFCRAGTPEVSGAETPETAAAEAAAVAAFVAKETGWATVLAVDVGWGTAIEEAGAAGAFGASATAADEAGAMDTDETAGADLAGARPAAPIEDAAGARGVATSGASSAAAGIAETEADADGRETAGGAGGALLATWVTFAADRGSPISDGPTPLAVVDALPRAGGAGIGVNASSAAAARSGRDAERWVWEVRSAGASARANAPANSFGVSNSCARA